MSHETFELIERLRQAGRRATMATLVRTIGTTPRKEGTKMFVGDGGNIFGSVTIGGCVDARVIEQAGEVLQGAEPRLLNLQLGDEEAWEIGLTCGGAVDIFVEPLSEPVVRLYDAARGEWEAGRSIAIATILSGDAAGTHLLIDGENVREVVSGSGRPPSEVPGEKNVQPGIIEVLSREVSKLVRAHATSRTTRYPLPDGTTADVYVEVLKPPSSLVIFGGGAVAIPLVTFARALGFRTMVIDNRERFANRDRFPDADEIRVGIASEIAGEIHLGASTPIVLVAHDYKVDIPVLKRALETEAPYIGLLGSRRRGAAILQMLRDDGVTEEQIKRVRVPVGLDIGGETAAEIALSVVAEIIAVAHGRSGLAMSARNAAQSSEPALQRS